MFYLIIALVNDIKSIYFEMKELLTTLCLCSWNALHCLFILYNKEYLQFYGFFLCDAF